MTDQSNTDVLRFDLSPTQGDFVFSPAVVNCIFSGTGEGKSYASVIAMLVHGQRNKKPIYCAIVRDTHENIKISTVRTIQETFDICEFPRRLYQFKNDFKELHIKSDPAVMVDLMGIDDPSSYSKLQGPQYALIWLEEPAPIVDKSNSGLAEDVFNLALVRCARQKNSIPRLQVSMNPAEDTHWTYRRLIEDPEVDPDYPLITKAVFRIPPGENKFLSEVAKQAVKSAYKNDPASWARYVSGQFAPSYRGKKVTPEYNPENFRSSDVLEPARGLVGFRGWDGWHQPSCVLGQITMSGRLVFLDTIRSEEPTDVRQLSAAKVMPLLNSPRWKDKCREWRDIGDWSMTIPDQSNRQESASRVIEDLFGTLFESGPAKWTHMKLGIHNAFTTNIDGRTSFILNPSERFIHRGLSGDWHYPTDNSGNITSKLPVKTDSSHVCDAWANVVNVLLGTYGQVKVTPEKLKRLRERQKNIAASY